MAVAAGFNVYLQLLDDADPLVRMAASYPLVVSEDRSSEIVPALLRLVDKDPDPLVRASALIGLSHVAGSDPAHLQRFERLLDSGEPAVVQLAAAMSLASLAGPAIPRRAVDVLCESITDPEPFNPLSRWWLWDTQVGDYLQSLGPALIRYATSLLLTNLLGSPTQSPGLLLIYIMDMNFDVCTQQAITPWELTDDQRDLLARLLRIDFFWDNEHNSLRTLMSYGLPITRHELQQFLASSSPHPN